MIRKFALLLATAAATMATAAAAPDDAPGSLLEQARVLVQAEPTAASERTLNAIVLELGRHTPDEATRQLLTELSARRPPILVRHEEGPALIPLVDVGAAARTVLRDWQRRDGFDRAQQLLRTRSGEFDVQFALADESTRDGMLDALARAAPAELAVLRDALMRGPLTPDRNRLSATVGLRLADPGLVAQVIAQGEPALVQSLLLRLDAHFDADTSYELLRGALERRGLASLALFRIAGLEADKARPLIWDRLADPALGATAAAILARQPDSQTIARLVGLLEHAPDELTRQRAALALSLMSDPYARALGRSGGGP